MARNFRTAQQQFLDFVYKPNLELMAQANAADVQNDELKGRISKLGDFETGKTFAAWQGDLQKNVDEIEQGLDPLVQKVLENPRDLGSQKALDSFAKAAKENFTTGPIGKMRGFFNTAQSDLKSIQARIDDPKNTEDKAALRARLGKMNQYITSVANEGFKDDFNYNAFADPVNTNEKLKDLIDVDNFKKTQKDYGNNVPAVVLDGKTTSVASALRNGYKKSADGKSLTKGTESIPIGAYKELFQETSMPFVKLVESSETEGFDVAELQNAAMNILGNDTGLIAELRQDFGDFGDRLSDEEAKSTMDFLGLDGNFSDLSESEQQRVFMMDGIKKRASAFASTVPQGLTKDIRTKEFVTDESGLKKSGLLFKAEIDAIDREDDQAHALALEAAKQKGRLAVLDHKDKLAKMTDEDGNELFDPRFAGQFASAKTTRRTMGEDEQRIHLEKTNEVMQTIAKKQFEISTETEGFGALKLEDVDIDTFDGDEEAFNHWRKHQGSISSSFEAVFGENVPKEITDAYSTLLALESQNQLTIQQEEHRKKMYESSQLTRTGPGGTATDINNVFASPEQYLEHLRRVEEKTINQGLKDRQNEGEEIFEDFEAIRREAMDSFTTSSTGFTITKEVVPHLLPAFAEAVPFQKVDQGDEKRTAVGVLDEQDQKSSAANRFGQLMKKPEAADWSNAKMYFLDGKMVVEDVFVPDTGFLGLSTKPVSFTFEANSLAKMKDLKDINMPAGTRDRFNTAVNEILTGQLKDPSHPFQQSIGTMSPEDGLLSLDPNSGQLSDEENAIKVQMIGPDQFLLPDITTITPRGGAPINVAKLPVTRDMLTNIVINKMEFK